MTLGRPTVYDPDTFPDSAEEAASNGATLTEIAQALGVTRSTVCLWMTQYDVFSDAIKRGRAAADERVEKALYQRALGYSHDSEKIVVVGGKDGSYVERVPIVEHYPPEPAALRMWLHNRKPQEWRDKQELEVTGKLDLSVALTERLQKAKDRAAKR